MYTKLRKLNSNKTNKANWSFTFYDFGAGDTLLLWVTE